MCHTKSGRTSTPRIRDPPTYRFCCGLTPVQGVITGQIHPVAGKEKGQVRDWSSSQACALPVSV